MSTEIASMVLVKIRSVLYTAYLPVIAIICCLIFWPTLFFRSRAHDAIRVWSRLAMGGLRVICGIRYRIGGAENIPEGAGFYACNHQSMWETFLLAGYFPKTVFILKKQLMWIPIFGWWCRACGFIPIDRAAGAASMRDILVKTRQRLDEGCQVIIFPEGSRKKPGAPGTYLPGVAGLYAMLNQPCQPIAHNSGLYWRHPSNLRIPGEIRLEFLEAIPEGLPRDAFLEKLKSVITARSQSLADEPSRH